MAPGHDGGCGDVERLERVPQHEVQVRPPRPARVGVAPVVVRDQHGAAARRPRELAVEARQVVDLLPRHVGERREQGRDPRAGRARLGGAVAGHGALRDDAQRHVMRRDARRADGGQRPGPGRAHQRLVGRAQGCVVRRAARGEAPRQRVQPRVRGAQHAVRQGAARLRCGDRLDRRALLLPGAERHHHVGTGLQRQHRGAVVAVAGVDRLHHQRVGDHDAAVAPLPAQQAAQDRSRQRGRVIGVEPRVDDVCGHHRRRLVAQRTERHELERLQLGQRLVDDRQVEMRIDVRVAVAREVLHAAGDAGPHRAAHPGAGQPRDVGRVFGKAALGDDRVRRVVVDVEHRREIPVEAHARKAAPDRLADRFGERHVAAGAERHRRRRVRQEAGAHERAAFLIDADQRALAHRLAQVGGEAAHLGLVAQVAAEQAHRADAVLAQERRLRGIEHRALDVDHHQPTRVNHAQWVLVTLARWRGRSGSKPRRRASASTIG